MQPQSFPKPEGVEIWVVGVPVYQRYIPSRALAQGIIYESVFVYGFQRMEGFRLRALGLRDFKQIPNSGQSCLCQPLPSGN